MAKDLVIGGESRTEIEELRAEVARKIAAHVAVEGPLETAVPGLRLSRRTAPSECFCTTYEPELVVFAQGEKRLRVGNTTHICDGSNFLLTSVDLPVESQIVGASKIEPYLALVLKLEMPVVREILSQEEFLRAGVASGVRGMAVGKTPAELLGACSRLLDLLDTPKDIPFLGSLMQREILYRLLRSPLGKHLRAIATLGEQSNRTAKAVVWLKSELHQAAARRRTCVCRADGRLDPAPSLSLADRDESAAISEAAAAARGARSDDHRRAGRGERGL